MYFKSKIRFLEQTLWLMLVVFLSLASIIFTIVVFVLRKEINYEISEFLIGMLLFWGTTILVFVNGIYSLKEITIKDNRLLVSYICILKPFEVPLHDIVRLDKFPDFARIFCKNYKTILISTKIYSNNKQLIAAIETCILQRS